MKCKLKTRFARPPCMGGSSARCARSRAPATPPLPGARLRPSPKLEGGRGAPPPGPLRRGAPATPPRRWGGGPSAAPRPPPGRSGGRGPGAAARPGQTGRGPRRGEGKGGEGDKSGGEGKLGGGGWRRKRKFSFFFRGDFLRDIGLPGKIIFGPGWSARKNHFGRLIPRKKRFFKKGQNFPHLFFGGHFQKHVPLKKNSTSGKCFF